MTVRSYLYTPGDRQGMLQKACFLGADAVIVDFEDAVAYSAKQTARSTTSSWMADRPTVPAQTWVRVNNHPALLGDDIDAAVQDGLTGIYIPKVDRATDIDSAASLMENAANRVGIDASSIRIAAIIETASGLQAVTSIAEHPLVSEIAIGEGDLSADLGIQPSPDEREWLAIRTQIVVACRAAGIGPPIGPASADFRDLKRFRSNTEGLRRLGFRSRAAIHPAQVEIINEVFTPTRAELDAAIALVAAYDEASARGSGVIVDAEGRMVDQATIRRARQVLAR